MRSVLVAIAAFGALIFPALRASMLGIFCAVMKLRLESYRRYRQARGRLVTAGIALALIGAAALAAPSAFAQNTAPSCESSVGPLDVVEGGTLYLIENPSVSCTDPDGPAPLTWSVVSGSGPSSGTLSSSPARYVPFVGFVGQDSFAVRAFDGLDYSNTITVYINVIAIPPGDQPPECPVATVFVEEGGFVDISINCRDPENDPISYGPAAFPTGGSLEIVPAPAPTVRYTPNPGTTSDSFAYTAKDFFHDSILVSVNITVIPAGAVTVSTGSEATPAEPYVASLTTTQPGPVIFEARRVTGPPPVGFSLLNQEFEITAPDALLASDPLQLVFTIDESIVPAFPVVVFRNGTAVHDCTGAPGVADPDPCVQEAVIDAEGDLRITVLSTKASVWTFGVASAYDFAGFFRPVDNRPTLNFAKAGSAIPVKFSLGGDQGLEIFAPGYPKSVDVNCDALAEADVDGIETTATAGSSGLSYDAAANQYTYVWKTLKNEWANTCRVLVLRFNDPARSTHSANFKFR